MAFFRSDVEMGKKDDEYKPSTRQSWRPRPLSQIPPRRSIRRIGLVVLSIVVFLCLLRYTMSEEEDEDIGSVQPIRDVLNSKGSISIATPTKAVPSKATSVGDRPIKFYDLATTLYAAGKTGGSSTFNRNVLFAAASLKSAALLLPIACEMAIQERSLIHFAFLGRDDIPMNILKSVNGINKDCKIMFHDGRPDFASESTDFRMEVSCSAAYNHINTYVHPQATIIDGSGLEEQYFTIGLKDRAMELENTIVELPENVEQNLMWITLLDSRSLAAWNKVTFDIIVHAQPSASGSLLRLLESIRKADYFQSPLPRLTIELPHDADQPTMSYLRNRFRWPPRQSYNGANLLTLHRRVPQHGITPEENSIRFLESFWPANPENSHVVVLSPQVELSPLFFHYLKYAVLEWKYSTRLYDATRTLGISLELPRTYLNGTSSFKPPKLKNSPTQFEWQAPNSNAMLYFGEHWGEIQDFISQTLVSQHKSPGLKGEDAKHVSKVHPSWLSHILSLARARGYTTIYPNLKSDSLVTIHTDLFNLPEDNKPKAEAKSNKEFSADVRAYIKHQKEQKLIKAGFLNFLKEGGSLPFLADMPTITFDGKNVSWEEMEELTNAYVTEFRKSVGRCSKEIKRPPMIAGKVGDLFCLDK